jgi:hypothetical protein
MPWDIPSGTTETIEDGERWEADAVDLVGTINLTADDDGDGDVSTLNLRPATTETAAGSGSGVGTATALTVRRLVATGTGTAIGTATPDLFRLVTADGIGEAFGAATYTKRQPMIRRNDADLLYDTDEEIELTPGDP